MDGCCPKPEPHAYRACNGMRRLRRQKSSSLNIPHCHPRGENSAASDVVPATQHIFTVFFQPKPPFRRRRQTFNLTTTPLSSPFSEGSTWRPGRDGETSQQAGATRQQKTIDDSPALINRPQTGFHSSWLTHATELRTMPTARQALAYTDLIIVGELTYTNPKPRAA